MATPVIRLYKSAISLDLTDTHIGTANPKLRQ